MQLIFVCSMSGNNKNPNTIDTYKPNRARSLGKCRVASGKWGEGSGEWRWGVLDDKPVEIVKAFNA